MTTRKRIRQLSSGAAGGVSPVIANVAWGPDFGDEAGNDGTSHEIRAALTLPALGLSSSMTNTTYDTTAVDYDGTNDYASRGALTGIADSSQGIFSAWVNPTVMNVTQHLFDAAAGVNNSRVNLRFGSNGSVVVVLKDTLGTTLVNRVIGTLPAFGRWMHFLFSWDMLLVTNNIRFYINDVSGGVASDPVGTVGYAGATTWGIGAHAPNGTSKISACLSEVFFHTSYLDISVEANRRKFISATLHPVSLGSNGSTPLGVQPLIYVPSGDPSTNLGSGGNFTVTGALTACNGSPNDGSSIRVYSDITTLAARFPTIFNSGVNLTGTAVGAPFWQSVQTATANTTPLTITKPASTASGNLLLAFVGMTVTSALAAPSVTVPAGWTDITSITVNGATNTTYGRAFYRIADGTEGATFDITFSPGVGTLARCAGEIHRITGTHATTPINASATASLLASGLDADPDSPSVTTTAANCLVFAWLGHDHLALAQTHTEPASHIETTDFEASTAGNRFGSTSDWRVFSAIAATGAAAHDCTETVATEAVMIRVAIAPGSLTLA